MRSKPVCPAGSSQADAQRLHIGAARVAIALNMSPTAESPASIPVRCGCTLPEPLHKRRHQIHRRVIPMMQSMCRSRSPCHRFGNRRRLRPMRVEGSDRDRYAAFSPAFSQTPIAYPRSIGSGVFAIQFFADSCNSGPLHQKALRGRPPVRGSTSTCVPWRKRCASLSWGSDATERGRHMSQCSKRRRTRSAFGLWRNQCRSFENPTPTSNAAAH